MDFAQIDILELLPQRPPFVLIDRLMHFDETTTVTQFAVPEAHLFVEAGELTASGLIENIAQTCAARMGYINCYIYKRTVKLGFIGAIRDLTVHRTPRVGELLTTTIRTIEEVFSMTLVEAEVRAAGELLVSARMKIALSDIDARQEGARP